jgi:protease-4
MNELPPVVTPPPKRTGWIVYSVIVTFLLFVTVLAVFALSALVFGTGKTTRTYQHAKYQEDFVQGDDQSRNKIAVVRLGGLISSAGDDYTGADGMVGEIRDQLDQAVADDRVKAIVLEINSPGGEVVASDDIYRAVREARDSKPVVVTMESMAASGGYYAAMGGDYIFAKDLTITASIGVILQTFTLGGYENSLLDKIGVHFYTFKSGRYKDLLNFTREPTEDEKAMVQSLVMEVYDKFVGIVAEERDIPVEKLKNGIADGRIMTGKQALEAGLVDELGYFDDAVDKAQELAKIKNARVIRYVQPFSLRNLFRFMGKSNDAKLQIQISPSRLALETGKLYFLPPHMFQ